MSKVINFAHHKALKEISEHYHLDINALRREKIDFNPDYVLDDDGSIEKKVEEDL
jgi:hypothetical protein